MIRDPLPQKVGYLEKVKICKVICGSDQSYCITMQPDLRVYSWGSNQNAKLGHSYFKTNPNDIPQSSIQVIKQPTQIKALDGQKIDGLSCGANHIFAWSSETGYVFGWGLGSNGRLGNEQEGVIQEPQILECLKEAAAFGMKVLKVSCGENHTLALIEIPQEEEGATETPNKQVKLFVWGSNDKFQLGMMNTDEEFQNSKEIKVPHQLDPDPFIDTKTNSYLSNVVASYYYSAALMSNGEIYTWGSGEFGRLGYQEAKRQAEPRLLKELSQQHITKLSLGYYHAAAINSEGTVFTWGRGINGQLGHGSILNEDSVRPVSALSNYNIIDIACGESHSIALTRIGEVYTWGGGQLGQLGHGDFLRQSLPIKVMHLEEKVASISCGKRHTAAISQEGTLYTWGSNEYGQLGRQANVTVGLYLKGSGSNSGSYNNSAKTSPSMNLIQSHQFHSKIPNSTDNQPVHKFEFPTSKGNSDGDLESNNLFLNKIAIDSVNLSWSQSPHQVFAPANRLHEISPYNQKQIPTNNPGEAGQFQQAQSQGVPPEQRLAQLEIHSDSSNPNQYPQQQFYHEQNPGGTSSIYSNSYTNNNPGYNQSSHHHDETPKYIKNLKGELNVALMKNMELRNKLEQMEEEQGIGLQNSIIEIGEVFQQKIKEADKTIQIEQVLA